MLAISLNQVFRHAARAKGSGQSKGAGMALVRAERNLAWQETVCRNHRVGLNLAINLGKCLIHDCRETPGLIHEQTFNIFGECTARINSYFSNTRRNKYNMFQSLFAVPWRYNLQMLRSPNQVLTHAARAKGSG